MISSVLELDHLDIDTVVDNSFKDFHAKGVDYVCLERTPGLTLKAYFFETGMQDASEVVNPHDHRYAFLTQCLSGAIRNRWYSECKWRDWIPPQSKRYKVFNWSTPLLGGNGFSPAGETVLRETGAITYTPNSAQKCYYMAADELHTIQVMQPETCILLAQYEDVIPDWQPTRTFTQTAEPPDLSGLYGKFTADEVVKRIELLKQLTEKA